MKQTKEQTKKRARIQKALDDYAQMAETGKTRGLTLFEVQSILFILKNLMVDIPVGTINASVAEWFEKRGFTVEPEGVGWRIL